MANGSVAWQPHRPRSPHPPGGPFRCGRWGAPPGATRWPQDANPGSVQKPSDFRHVARDLHVLPKSKINPEANQWGLQVLCYEL